MAHMRRTTWLFILLLAVLNAWVYSRHRVLPLFEAALLLNTLTFAWWMRNAFRPRESQIPVTGGLKAIVVILLITLNSFVLLAAYLNLQAAKHPNVVMSERLPDFEWTGFDGAKHKSTELAGRVAVLHFWAAWCVPCRHEFPRLIAFAQAQPGITFLAVDANDDREKAEAYIARLNGKDKQIPPNILFAWDPHSEISYDLFKVFSFPSNILVDVHGVMRERILSPIDWDSQEIQNVMDGLSRK